MFIYCLQTVERILVEIRSTRITGRIAFYRKSAQAIRYMSLAIAAEGVRR